MVTFGRDRERPTVTLIAAVNEKSKHLSRVAQHGGQSYLAGIRVLEGQHVAVGQVSPWAEFAKLGSGSTELPKCFN